ncbi:MAG: MCE family protein [Solirubrobacterales bacterium]|nr:MCE family protein [Solirubrobacterales bacterium]
MRRAIREHLRDFIAVAALLVIGLAVTIAILSQQQQPYPSWIPFLGDDRFELKAEFTTAQAVTPGQGQTVNIAGVEAGDISEVELEGGRAVVTMLVDEKYAPLINTDATMLLRPRTGLQDMTVDVDVGDSGEPVSEGETIPVSQTEPNVQPDQILASLDGDTRAYLKLLISGGSEGLGSRAKGRQLSAGLRRFEPLGRYLAQIGDALSERRRNIAGVITSLRELGVQLGRTDVRLSDWVSSQNSAIGAFADQEASLRETLAEFPSALRETRTALRSGDRLALELGPASRALIPAAQAFAPAQRSLQGFFASTTGPIRDQIRPFTTEVQPTVRHVKQAAGPLAATTRGLGRSLADLNRLFNGLAYNPPGPTEGYLFWLAWLNHNQNNAFMTQDSAGPLLRGAVLQACGTAVNAEAFASARPFIRTLQQITNVTPAAEICPLDPTAPPIPITPIVPPIRP